MIDSVEAAEKTTLSPKTLVIGVVADWVSAGKTLPQDPTLKYIEVDEISEALLERFEPEVVLSPLVGKGFDAIDVAVRLTSCGYVGRLRATSPDLPNPKLVTKEIRSICPKIDFDLLILSELSKIEH